VGFLMWVSLGFPFILSCIFRTFFFFNITPYYLSKKKSTVENNGLTREMQP
jgi:hypothetical protein